MFPFSKKQPKTESKYDLAELFKTTVELHKEVRELKANVNDLRVDNQILKNKIWELISNNNRNSTRFAKTFEALTDSICALKRHTRWEGIPMSKEQALVSFYSKSSELFEDESNWIKRDLERRKKGASE